MKIATMGRNYFDNSDSDDGALRSPRGVAKGSVGEGAGMVISVGSVSADSSGSESVGILGYAKRTATPALLPVAVLSASAVLIAAFLAVASFRDITAGHRDRHQQFQHRAERGANGGSTTVEGPGGRQLTLRALSPPAPLSSSLGDGGGRECPYVITEAKADVVIAATAAAATAETQVGEPAVPSSPLSSSSSSSSFWPSPASPPSVQGSPAERNNVLTVTNFNYSRLGNRFISLARNLGLGYCCKSRLVSLPPKDDIIAPGVFSEGVPGPRWFDFSSAPDVEGFNASTCPESITWGGQDAFYLTGVRDEDHPYSTPGLFECIKALPRLAGCEADYFFPADKVDVCLSDTPGLGYTLDEKRSQEEGPYDDGVKLYGVSGHDRKGDEGDGLLPRVGKEPAVHGSSEPVEEEGAQGKQRGGDASEGQWEQGRGEQAHEPTRERQMWQGKEEQGRGREEWGDDHDEGGHPWRRQLEKSGTDDITVVVNHKGEGGAGEEQEAERSGREVGEEGEAAGSLVVHVRSGDIFVDPAHPFYGQPPLEYYVRAMEHQRWDRIDVVTNGYQDEKHVINPVVPALEAKVASGELTGDIHFHKNRTMGEDLLSMLCGDGFVAAKSTVRHLVSRHSSATRMYFPHACDDKLRDLGLERPGIKVFGMVWQEEDYTVYQRWNNSQEQLSEIVNFAVPGFEQCGDRELDP